MTATFGKRRARLHAMTRFHIPIPDMGGQASSGPAPGNGTATSGPGGNRFSLGLWAVVGCQFTGAFNDHFFKMMASLIAIEVGRGGGGGSAFLSLSGIVYVLPFLLFSGFAGALADRFEKRTVMIFAKGSEALIAALALYALLIGDIALILAVLFLFAAQSAFFSPPKYGILPDIVAPRALPRANGLIEFSRYVAIIGGTAIAGVLSSFWGRNSLGLGLLIVAVALLGWIWSLAIPALGARPPSSVQPGDRASRRRVGIRLVLRHPKLRLLVSLTTGLDFAMTLVSLVVLLMAKRTMALGDLESGLLIALAGIGIAAGAMLAGLLSRGRAELGFLPLGAAGVSAALIILSGSTRSYPLAAFALTAMGASTGFLVVPLYTALQKTAPAGERGRVIGANNFFNMGGVLVGSALLWVLHDGFGLSPQAILLTVALGVLIPAVSALGRSARLRARVSLLMAVAWESIHRILLFGLAWVRHVSGDLATWPITRRNR